MYRVWVRFRMIRICGIKVNAWIRAADCYEIILSLRRNKVKSVRMNNSLIKMNWIKIYVGSIYLHLRA